MKLNFKLSIMVVAILAVVVATVAVVLLQRSGKLTVGLNVDALEYIGNWHSSYWQGREDQRIQVMRSIADYMSDYEAMSADTRRDEFERIISVYLDRNPDYITYIRYGNRTPLTEWTRAISTGRGQAPGDSSP